MNNLTINKKYKPLFNLPKGVRYFIATGGRGSSKSFSIQTAVTYHADKSDRKILSTRVTMTSANLSIIPEFVEKIELLGVEDRFNVNKSEITCVTGSQIIFKGLKTSSGDQKAQLKSLQAISMWVLDEAEELTDERTFDKIDLSIRSNKYQNVIILILNPATKEHWIYKRFFERAGVGPGFNGQNENVYYIHSTYLDNLANLPQDYIDRLEEIKLHDVKKYDNIVLGGWLQKSEGVIYERWSYGEFDDTIPYTFGMDFGYSIDPDAIVKVAIDNKRKKIYAQEYLYQNKLGQSELYERVKAICVRDEIIADSAESRMIADFRRDGLNIKAVQKGADSVKAGIKIIQSYELIIEKNSLNLAKELNNYVWDDRKSEKPVDKYNHLLDALRYVVFSKEKPLKAPTYYVDN